MSLPNILIVDDSKFMCFTISDCLLKEFPSINIISTDSFNSALHEFISNDIDLVITDYVLPGKKNGVNLLEKLYSFDDDFYSIVISSLATQEIINNSFKIGASAFIKKPFNRNKLNSIVKDIFSCNDVTKIS